MTLNKTQKPWFKKPRALKKGSKVAIIGGGISGVSIAYHLLKSGYDPTIIENNSRILSGASGNPAAILDPYLSIGDGVESTFYAAAYKYSVNFYKSLSPDILTRYDLTKIIEKQEHIDRFREIRKKYPDALADGKKFSLTFRDGGLVRPQKLAEYMKDILQILYNKEVSHFDLNDKDQWDIYDINGRKFLDADAVVVCNSYDNLAFNQTKHVKLSKVSGQISFLAPQYKSPSILCSDGYITPPIETDYGPVNMCGATFDNCNSDEITEDAHSINIGKSPYKFVDPKILGGRRATRAMSSDHLPICGPVAKYSKYIEKYSDLHHGPNHKNFADAPYFDKLFINVGLGARGFLTAPLLAIHLTSLISGTPTPLNENIYHALHPARFIIRDLSKK